MKKNADTTGLWLVSDVADYLNISPRAVYRLVAASALPHIRLGRRLRFAKTDIDEHLDRLRSSVMAGVCAQ